MIREIIPLKQRLSLTLALPGSKSITNRAFLCAALAKGKSVIKGALVSDDTRVMLTALRQLDVAVTKQKNGDYVVRGGGGKFHTRPLIFHLGNAGTATRFLTAVMAVRGARTVITGDARMQERPIADLVDGLRQIGATIEYRKKDGCPPLVLRAPDFRLQAKKEYVIRMRGNKSSQYCSALLMLAPLLDKPLRLKVIGGLVSKPYIDVTIGVMKAFGVTVTNKQYKEFLIRPRAYRACRFQVEGDASAASYWHSLNFLHGGALQFTNLGLRSVQGDVNYPKALKKLGKGTIDMNAMPDVAMTLAVTAPFAKGVTRITNIGNLRVKESDRLAALKNELKKIGVDVKTTNDSITIVGHVGAQNSPPLPNNDIEIRTYSDHRMAMCFAVLGTRVPGISIEDPDCVDKTYPQFWEDLEMAYLAPLKIGRRHLVLIGMRGCGKNHLGKLIARHLKRPLIDLDHAIERQAGLPIQEVVKRHGWAEFRKLEQKICSQIGSIAQKPSVIATGGGVVLSPANMRHLKKACPGQGPGNALTVFVFASPSVLAWRIAQKTGRPALKKGHTAVSELEQVWRERRQLYLRYADVVWDNTSGRVVKENLKTIL